MHHKPSATFSHMTTTVDDGFRPVEVQVPTRRLRFAYRLVLAGLVSDFGSATGAGARVNVRSDAVSVAALSAVTCVQIAVQRCWTRDGGVRDKEIMRSDQCAFGRVPEPGLRRQ